MCKRELVQLGSRIAPCGIVLRKDGYKSLAVCGFKKMDHFMNNDILYEVFGFLDELGI
jgi:hypothetical protein